MEAEDGRRRACSIQSAGGSMEQMRKKRGVNDLTGQLLGDRNKNLSTGSKESLTTRTPTHLHSPHQLPLCRIAGAGRARRLSSLAPMRPVGHTAGGGHRTWDR